MPADPIISVSGLRGVVGDSLTEDVAARYALALAAHLPPGAVVIGRDGRPSGPLFVRAIAAALTGAGRPVIDAGVAATPTVGVLVREQRAAGGIQISASHNPPQYNGIKLFNAAGRVIPAVDGQQVLNRYHAAAEQQPPEAPTPHPAATQRAAAAPPGTPPALTDTTAAHLALVEAICDVDRIRSRKFHVLLDANHGAGSVLARPLLARLGCQATILGGQPDGQFEHVPEPTEANLAPVLDRVVKAQAAIGFAQDPDADRLAIIDERGRYIGEEKTLALCVDHVLRHQRQGPVAINCSTSRMTEVLAQRYGVPCFRAKVGEANVVDLMLQTGAVFGGEGNGGVIDPRVVLVRDSFVGMALALDAMAARGLPASELANELPQFAIHKTTISTAPERVAAALDALERRFSDATADRLDGLRLDWPDGAWLLVRPSNTELIVRAIAEAPTPERAQRLCQSAAAVISAP
ncbi:MAG: phosphoglucosamine mutase [Planctomycetota bacterium]|nr:MAG: phosphoglucosamine mutase [Planctomycetota bacterium]